MLEGEEITPILATLKQYNPNILTIVLTKLKDSNIIINLINQAQVFRYLPKPIHPALLNKSVIAAT
ncbi:chemotaxis protein CheY, partial [Achromatium sp. WMS3]